MEDEEKIINMITPTNTNPQAEKELEVLKTCSKTLENSNIKSVKDEPIAAVEDSLSVFVRDAFEATRSDFDFDTALQNEILSRLPSMNNSELLALFSTHNVNLNDKMSKVLAPTFGVITSRQQAEIATSKMATASGQDGKINVTQNIQNVNKEVDPEVLQGLTQLGNLLNALNINNKEDK